MLGAGPTWIHSGCGLGSSQRGWCCLVSAAKKSGERLLGRLSRQDHSPSHSPGLVCGSPAAPSQGTRGLGIGVPQKPPHSGDGDYCLPLSPFTSAHSALILFVCVASSSVRSQRGASDIQVWLWAHGGQEEPVFWLSLKAGVA